jgi:hypothetical protein
MPDRRKTKVMDKNLEAQTIRVTRESRSTSTADVPVPKDVRRVVAAHLSAALKRAKTKDE